MEVKVNLSKYGLEEIKELWQEIEKRSITKEAIMVRGWLMDRMEELASPESFEKWLNTDNLEDLKNK